MALRVDRPLVKAVASSLLVDKGNYRHFMAKEIHEQPEVISHTLANYLDMATARVHFPGSRHRSCEDQPRHDLGLRNGLLCGPRCEILDRAVCARGGRYRCCIRDALPRERRCLKAVSRSSSRSLAKPPIRWRRSAIARLTANASHRSSTFRTSTIARESHAALPTLAGPEIGVASTKAFTCQLSVLACLAIAIARARETDNGRAGNGTRQSA